MVTKSENSLIQEKGPAEILELAHEHWGHEPVPEEQLKKAKSFNVPPKRDDLLTTKQVQDEIHRSIIDVEERIQRIHELALLEGALHCDEFHKTKRSFQTEEIRYGQITSKVRQMKGTNRFEFGVRRVSADRKVFLNWNAIKYTKSGYARVNFRPHATYKEDQHRVVHTQELELCCHTEEHYKRLRTLSSICKKLIRLMKTTPYYKNEF